MRVQLVGVVVVAVLLGCATAREITMGDQLAKEGKWEGAIFLYQEALKSDPKNTALREKLIRIKTQAAEEHYLRGREYLKEKNVGLALEEFKRALTYDPSKEEHQSAVLQAMKAKEAVEHYNGGVRLQRVGKDEEAMAEFEKALELDPAFLLAQDAVAKLTERITSAKKEEGVFASEQKITLKFQNTRLKEVVEALSKTFQVNIILDKDVRDDPVTIFLKDATFSQALNLILTTNSLFMKKVSADTILIIPQTPAKTEQYEDHMIRTFYLSNTKAKDMVNMMRTMLETKRIFVNEEINALIIRDTTEKLKLAGKIIEANDRRAAEVMFDVEILEIDRTNSLKIGWNFSPPQATFSLRPPGVTGAIPLERLKGLGDAAYLFTLPSIIVDFMKQESDAQTLAQPRIRVVNNKPAKVNIGDKVPILLSTTQTNPGTQPGQIPSISVVNSIEFKDTGIKLTVEPDIHLTDEVTIKLSLEVTSLGDLVDLGGSPPIKQFRFGTRSTETVLNVRDGETVIIGGLIRDDERTTVTKVPGLGDVPILGKLFTNTEKGKVKTDVLLTLTPHVVRSLETPSEEIQSFWSGTERNFSTRPLFEESQ